jgi:hypothetical protein
MKMSPDRFTLDERAPDIHWVGGWVAPRTGLDAMENRLIFPSHEPRFLGHLGLIFRKRFA